MNKRLVPVVALCLVIILAIVYHLLTPSNTGSRGTNGSSATASYSPTYLGLGNTKCCLLIANATGGFEQVSRINSKESFVNSIKKGFRYIEVDFSQTSDDKWVATPNWQEWKKLTGHTGEGSIDLKTFTEKRYSIDGNNKTDESELFLTPLTLEEIAELLNKHPDVFLIVDAEEELHKLVSTLADLPIAERVVVQVYRLGDIKWVRSKGFHSVILSFRDLAKKTRHKKIIKNLLQNKDEIIGASFPIYYFNRYHKSLAKTGVPIYVYGREEPINNKPNLVRYAKQGASGFFVDWYTPKK